MGCCQTKGKYGAYRHDLDVPLLEEIAPKLNSTSRVIVVKLILLKEILIGNSFSSTTDAYVEFKIIPNDPIAGLQIQLSSIKPKSLSPKWEPPEIFKFISSKPKDAKIVLSVYHYNFNNPKDSTPLGDGIIKLRDIELQAEPHIIKAIKLVSPKDGSPAGEAEVSIHSLTLQEAAAIQEHTVYEFQRWSPIHSWGSEDSPKHLLPSDPGCWCTENGKKFAKSIESVSSSIPPGWIVDDPWHTISTDEDPEGWQYSTTFESPYWYPQNDSAAFVVRRRTWHRRIKLVGSFENQEKNSSRRKRMFS